VLSDSGSHHSSENESSQNGSVRKVVGSSSSGVSSDLSDPDSDGSHDDERGQIMEHHDADDEVDDKENAQTFLKPKHGNKRKKEKIMVEISTQTKDDQSPVTMVAMEMDKLSTDLLCMDKMICHEKLFPSRVNSRRSVDEVSLDNEKFEKLKEDYQYLTEQKRKLEMDIEISKEDNQILQAESSMALEKENLRKIVRLQEIEHELRNQLEEWEKSYQILQEKNRSLLEDKCELEEAENDSRLQAQR